MKIKVGDPDANWAQVYLNGALVTQCVSADEEAGEATVYKLDATGRIIWLDGIEPELEVLKGKVKIVIGLPIIEEGWCHETS